MVLKVNLIEYSLLSFQKKTLFADMRFINLYYLLIRKVTK